MADNYDGLREYLTKRYADSIVLTFDQVEALLGFPLAHSARVDPSWWSNDESAADAGPQAHSRAWTRANRTATPNLGARTVLFVRNPE